MRTERFWTGVAMVITVCVLVIMTTSPGYSSSAAGRIEGRITYKGQPVKGGTILFVSGDRKRCDDHFAMIDAEGGYQTDTRWRREGPGRTPFQILVLLDPRKYPADRRLSDPGRTDEALDAGGPGSRAGAVEPSGIKIRRVVWGADGPYLFDQPDRSKPQHRFGDFRTSDLAVTLGPAPAQVDIDLND